jgi:hypothetical protein
LGKSLGSQHLEHTPRYARVGVCNRKRSAEHGRERTDNNNGVGPAPKAAGVQANKLSGKNGSAACKCFAAPLHD